jgi:hypothetical protein
MGNVYEKGSANDMSMFKRIADILRSQKQQPALPSINPFEDSSVGDIATVDLEEYVVTGKVIYFDPGFAPHRYLYYLRNGRTISALLVEKGREYECYLCEFVEGALDDPSDIPTRLTIDNDRAFELENHRNDMTRTEGNTDFRSGDEVMIVRYFSGEDDCFFLQWQDGKFVAMLGSRTPSSQVKFMKPAQ